MATGEGYDADVKARDREKAESAVFLGQALRICGGVESKTSTSR
jgi:hypothetical protein